MRKTVWLAAAMISATTHGALAGTLITEAEAALPAAAGSGTLRGLTRGPTIKLVSPGATKSPFELKLKFEAHGGAKIEPGSLKVVYLKSPTVDITDRVKEFVTADGLDMTKAEVPAGQHSIRFDVKDSDGRVGSATVQLSITK